MACPQLALYGGFLFINVIPCLKVTAVDVCIICINGSDDGSEKDARSSIYSNINSFNNIVHMVVAVVLDTSLRVVLSVVINHEDHAGLQGIRDNKNPSYSRVYNKQS